MSVDVRCTAIVDPGATTSRVKRVIAPKKDARELLERADQIRRQNARRLGPCLPSPESNPGRPWRQLGISAYVDDIERMDAAIEVLKAAGHTKMSRSELLRIAFARLDLEALLKDLA